MRERERERVTSRTAGEVEEERGACEAGRSRRHAPPLPYNNSGGGRSRRLVSRSVALASLGSCSGWMADRGGCLDCMVVLHVTTGLNYGVELLDGIEVHLGGAFYCMSTVDPDFLHTC